MVSTSILREIDRVWELMKICVPWLALQVVEVRKTNTVTSINLGILASSWSIFWFLLIQEDLGNCWGYIYIWFFVLSLVFFLHPVDMSLRLAHIYYICMWKKVQVLGAQSCLTLCETMDCSPPGSSVHGYIYFFFLIHFFFSFFSWVFFLNINLF